uniref:Uncharacterized protein n=1 Tax=Arundo donax TaxID=35708 RepID=A0A0A9HF46_ARUDO
MISSSNQYPASHIHAILPQTATRLQHEKLGNSYTSQNTTSTTQRENRNLFHKQKQAT